MRLNAGSERVRAHPQDEAREAAGSESNSGGGGATAALLGTLNFGRAISSSGLAIGSVVAAAAGAAPRAPCRRRSKRAYSRLAAAVVTATAVDLTVDADAAEATAGSAQSLILRKPL